MTRTIVMLVFALSAVLFLVSAATAAVPNLLDPGFDLENASGGDVELSAGWLGFNNAFVTQSVPAHSAPNSLKSSTTGYAPGASGAFQGDYATSVGQVWYATVWARIDSSDPMNSANIGQLALQFLPNPNFGPPVFTPITTSSLPLDTWQQFSVTGIAPAGATSVRLELMQVQLSPSASTGSIFFDDATLAIIPEPTSGLLICFGILGCWAQARRRAA